MNCPNCKVAIAKGSKYCPSCGLLFESDDVKKYTEIYNTDFMEIYFPNKELKFHIDRISVGYLLFTYFYAIYKKMYKIAIISFLSQIISFKTFQFLSEYFEKSFGTIFYLGFFIILGLMYLFFYYVFNFDRLLIENRKYKINKILRENEGKDKEKIIKIMEEDSKNNYKGLIIVLLLAILYIGIKLLF